MHIGSFNFAKAGPLITLPADEVKVGKSVFAILIIGQLCVTPEPALGEIAAGVMPFNAASRGTEGFGKFTAPARGVEFSQQVEQRRREILAPQEYTAESALIQSVVFIAGKAFSPIVDTHKQTPLTLSIADQTQMP